MRQALFGAVVGGILVAVAAAAAQPTVTPAPEVRGVAGRFQIVDVTADVLLLDTATGDSWVKCASSETSAMWCAMLRSANMTRPRTPVP
jgi:hypothetical protein